MPLEHPELLVRAMLEHNTVAILLFDKTGQIIFANQAAYLIAAESLQGTMSNALIAATWGKPFNFDGNPIQVSDWPTVLALKGQKTVGKEIRMVRPDGSHYDISISASPLMAEDSEIIGAIVTFIDVTERRLAEQELTAINARMEQLASERARGIHLMHLIGLSAQSIGSIKEMFQTALTEICHQMRWPVGYAYIVEARGRLHGITAWHSSDPERYEPLRRTTASIDFSRKESVIGQVIKSGKPVFARVDSELFLRREAALQQGLKSCLAIPVLAHNEPAAILEFFHRELIEPQDSLLEVMEVIGAHLGLTIEQKRTEQKLQALFDSAPDAQIVTDNLGKIVMANKQTISLFGYSREELLGQPVELLVSPELRTQHIEHRAEYTARPHPRPMGVGAELKGLRRDRTEIPVEISLSPIELDGELLISSAIRDVTERKKLEQRLRERERLADIGTAAAIFAHEIANPLNAMRMAAQMITEHISPEHHDECDILGEELERLRSLLDQFRSLNGIANVKLVSGDLRKLTERVIKSQSAAWHERGVRITTSFSEDLQLCCDEEKLQQVILNLCKNAVESMPSGGTLTLRIYRSGNNVITEVSDTGSGVPEGMEVFKLFASTKPKGAGLGLYIVQQIVAAHNGTISYSSELEKGTTFRMSLPRNQDLVE